MEHLFEALTNMGFVPNRRDYRWWGSRYLNLYIVGSEVLLEEVPSFRNNYEGKVLFHTYDLEMAVVMLTQHCTEYIR